MKPDTTRLTICLTVGLFTAVAPLGAQPCTAPPAGLVGWWSGDGHFFDLAGTNHGTPAGGVTFTSGEVGRAFNFDGDNGFLEVADSAALRLTNTLTIEFWAKRQRFGIDVVLEKGGDWNTAVGGEANYGIGFHQINSNMFYFFFKGGWRGVPGVSDLAWHHYAVVATNGQANPAFYVDGLPQTVQYSDGPAAVIELYASPRPLHVGAQVFSLWNYYGNTALDELAIYSRALSAAEIAAIYTAGSAGKCKPPAYRPAGLVSWWRGEGDASDTMGVHPGTPQGGLGYSAGQVGQAFVLNGQDAAVALGNWFTLQQFTLSFWVKPNASQVTYADILDNVHSDYKSWCIQFDNVSDAARSYWHWGTSLPSGGGSLSFALTTGDWQHWVVTLGADRVQHLYMDGKLTGSTANTAAIPYDGSQYFNIGKHQIYGRYFNGMVDELMCFDRALGATEVASLYMSQGGRPTLEIERQSGGVLLSWPAGGANLTLEARADLGSGSWQTLTNAVFVPAGDRTTVPLTVTDGQRFFRLAQ